MTGNTSGVYHTGGGGVGMGVGSGDGGGVGVRGLLLMGREVGSQGMTWGQHLFFQYF